MQDRPPTKTTPDLFTPINIGPLALPNRIAMAPLTRSRAAEGNVPTALNALYYAQRASAALIISEATQVAPEGQGYISTPGIHSAEQIKGWQCVTGAVHASGGRSAPALACRAHLASVLPAERQIAGGPVGHQADRTGLHRQRLRADPNPACSRARRDSRHRCAICARRAQRDGSRLRRRRGAWRKSIHYQNLSGQCQQSRPVLGPQRQRGDQEAGQKQDQDSVHDQRLRSRKLRSYPALPDALYGHVGNAANKRTIKVTSIIAMIRTPH